MRCECANEPITTDAAASDFLDAATDNLVREFGEKVSYPGDQYRPDDDVPEGFTEDTESGVSGLWTPRYKDDE